jgi:ADP-ribose pyrophosphatase YjhB (NUDIX family)
MIEVIARGVIVQQGHVLLCQHAKKKYLYLPGGHVEFGETAAEALARELVEEAGVKIRVGPCLLVQEHLFEQGQKARHEVNLIFQASLPTRKTKRPGSRTGTIRPGSVEAVPIPIVSLEEGIGFVWLPIVQIARARLVPPTHRAWLVRALSRGGAKPSALTFESAF